MLNRILYGINKQSQNRLDELFRDLRGNPNILWYPSAGNDYSDILEINNERANLNGINEIPELYIHTDYNLNFLNLEENQIIFNDLGSTVQIVNKYELNLRPNAGIIYEINPNFVDFPNDAPTDPTIYLLDLKIISENSGEKIQPILYFIFENINFLDQVLLKNKISISHIVKVCEGCGFGGNAMSISLAYAFLSILNTKYLIIDTEEHTNFELIDQLKRKHRINPFCYNLQAQNPINPWSEERSVNVFSVSYPVMDNECLQKILKKIRNPLTF